MLKKKKKVNDNETLTRKYFNEISKYKSLTKEEEKSLWERYKKDNDLSARDKLITSNLKFVANIAKPYIGKGLPYSDLIAEGNLGLMKAIDRFDYKKDVKTISYSVWWIRQSIIEALNERNYLSYEELPGDFERPVDFNGDEEEHPSHEKYNITEDYIIRESLSKHDLKAIVRKLINCLSENEKAVITDYFGIGETKEMTLEEIGEKMKVSRERVRQIKDRAMNKLRSEILLKSIKIEI